MMKAFRSDSITSGYSDRLSRNSAANTYFPKKVLDRHSHLPLHPFNYLLITRRGGVEICS